MATILDDRDHRSLDPVLLRSGGRAMPGSGISIKRVGTGETLPRGEVGEVCLRSGSVMREYWGRPVETAEALVDGWLHTGDVGYQDERGYLWLTDRAKDMIISGGENIYSIEVENALSTHPAVSQVAVIGRPHHVWGETVHAVIRLREGCTADEKDIEDHARSRIAAYKIPRSIEFRTEEFPLSPVGKVRKDELRKQVAGSAPLGESLSARRPSG